MNLRNVLPAILILFSSTAITLHGQWSTSPNDNTAVCRESGDQTAPMIVPDGQGGTIIAWQDARNGATDILAQRLDAYGIPMWEEDGLVVCGATGAQNIAGLVPDGTGGAFVVWRDWRSVNADVYAQRLDAAGAGQWGTDGFPIATTPEDQREVTATSDGTGGLLIVWSDSTGTSGFDIKAQRLSPDGIPQWGTGGIAISAATGDQTHPGVAGDGNGGAFITWEDERDAGVSLKDIYAQRVRPEGVAAWTTDGIPVCTVGEDQWFPHPVADGPAHVIIFWEDGRTAGSVDIYAQGVDSSGAALWTAGGEVVCDASGDQVELHAASDGAGGAFVVWTDLRTPATAADVYGQRLNFAGIGLWGDDGIAICAANGSQDSPALRTDGAGGMVVAWHDARSSGDEDIYAQAVDGAGSVRWTSGGRVVSSAREDQSAPAVSPDGNGGAVVVWEDTRQLSSRGRDIYVQNVNDDGTLGLPAPSWTSRYNNPAANKKEGMGFKIKTVAKLIARGLAVDRLGNSYVTGYSDGGGTKFDYLTVKYDLFGNKVWEARYNGSAGKIDKSYAIVVDDWDVFVTGESQGVDSGYDIVTIKYDSSGEQVWAARYNNPAGGKKDAGYAISPVGRDDIICVAGESDGGSGAKADIIVIGYDAETGAQLWVRTYNGPGNGIDKAYAVDLFQVPSESNKIVVTGESNGGPSSVDYATIQYALADGTQEWVARYDGPTSGKDYAYTVRYNKRTESVCVTGASSGPAKFDYATVSYDAAGIPMWVARYDNASTGKSDIAYDLAISGDGEIYVTGTSESATKFDFATVKYLEDGTQAWVNRYDGGIGKKDIARALVLGKGEDTLFVTGSSEQGAGRKWDYLTLSIDATTGATGWIGRYNGTGMKHDHAFNLAVRPGGGSLVVTGTSDGGPTKIDYATLHGPVGSPLPGPIVGLAIDDGGDEEGEEWGEDDEGELFPERFAVHQNYPNPFNPHTTISYRLPEPSQVRLTVYDILGRIVELLLEEEQEEGLQEAVWDASGIASGVYFYRLESSSIENPGEVLTGMGKMLLVR